MLLENYRRCLGVSHHQRAAGGELGCTERPWRRFGFHRDVINCPGASTGIWERSLGDARLIYSLSAGRRSAQ